MKKIYLLFCMMAAWGTQSSGAFAVTIKKAASVAPQETTVSSGAASLMPTVLNLVSGIKDLNQKQKALTAECIPSSQEITFVDNTIKEWAKTGAMSAAEVEKRLKRKRCSVATGGYGVSVQVAAGTESGDICFDYFAGAGNDDMVWAGYPKVGRATYCSDGSLSCSEKDKKNASDIYEIFNLVDFSEADYTKQEAAMAARLIAKIEQCSSAKLSAKKKAMWGEFLVDTLGSVGQSTNTGTILDQVGAISSGGLNTLPSSLGSMLPGLMGQ